MPKPKPKPKPRSFGLWLHPHAPAAVNAERPRAVHWAYRDHADPADYVRVAEVYLPDYGEPLRGPKLSRFGIVADPSRQSYGMGGPFRFYADFTRTCRECRDEFTFSAEDQRFWYEELSASSDAAAARCRTCRRAERAHRQAHVDWDAAHRAWRASATTETTLALASAGLSLVRSAGATPRILDELVGALRRATRVDPDSAPLLAWTARVELARGRLDAAKAIVAEYLSRSDGDLSEGALALRQALGTEQAELAELAERSGLAEHGRD